MVFPVSTMALGKGRAKRERQGTSEGRAKSDEQIRLTNFSDFTFQPFLCDFIDVILRCYPFKTATDLLFTYF